MRMHPKMIMLILALALSRPLLAQDSPCQTKTVVYFGNGIGSGITTYKNAQITLLYLKGEIKKTLPVDKQAKFEYALAFNQSAEKLGDFKEVCQQILGNEWPTLFVALGYILPAVAEANPVSAVGTMLLLNLVPPDIKFKFNELFKAQFIKNIATVTTSSNSDVQVMVKDYEIEIHKGKKVVIVSHSQGNVFANLAFDQLSLTSQKYAAIVPVASPESFIRKNFVGHVRFTGDLVIKATQYAKFIQGLALPLPANDEDLVNDDFLSHDFINAYLANSSSRNFIVDGVIKTEAALPNPMTDFPQSAITAKLTWTASTFFNLHVYEPTGTHVWYKYPNGENFKAYGKLYHPPSDKVEYYRSSCNEVMPDSLNEGHYKIAANYWGNCGYGGNYCQFFYYEYSGPATSVMTVTTPTSEATRTVTWSYPFGDAGNYYAPQYFDIKVLRDTTSGKLTYEIH